MSDSKNVKILMTEKHRNHWQTTSQMISIEDTETVSGPNFIDILF